MFQIFPFDSRYCHKIPFHIQYLLKIYYLCSSVWSSYFIVFVTLFLILFFIKITSVSSFCKSLFILCARVQSSRGDSPLLAAPPMRRFSGILPLHGAAHKKDAGPGFIRNQRLFYPVFLFYFITFTEAPFSNSPMTLLTVGVKLPPDCTLLIRSFTAFLPSVSLSTA